METHYQLPPGSSFRYDAVTNTLTIISPMNQSIPSPKKPAKRYPLDAYLSDGQKVRIAKYPSWEGVYNMATNRIVRGNVSYRSFTNFVEGHIIDRKGKRNGHTEGIQLCELETNGAWSGYNPTP